jgi:translation initiation factor RLI1
MKKIAEKTKLENNKISLDEKSQYLFDLALKNNSGKLPELDLSLTEIKYHNKEIIVFEGINACGKTTQINLLRNLLKNKNDDFFLHQNILIFYLKKLFFLI